LTEIVRRHAVEGGQKIIERRVFEDGSIMPPTPVVYVLGGQQYPLKTVKNCKTCNIQPRTLRFDVEEQIIAGFSKAAIARALPESLGISSENLSQHVKSGHMPLDAEIRDTLIEIAHERVGDPQSPSLVTDLGMATIILHKVFQKVTKGDYDKTLTIQDGFMAATFIRKVEEMGQTDADSEIVVEHFRKLWEAIEATGSSAWAEAINDYINADPILRKIKSRALPAVAAESWEAGEPGFET
jgi:hypothetical protein